MRLSYRLKYPVYNEIFQMRLRLVAKTTSLKTIFSNETDSHELPRCVHSQDDIKGDLPKQPP